VFEKTYADAHVPLPGVTRLLIAVGALAKGYGPMAALGALVLVVSLVHFRRRDHLAARMDGLLLRMPMFGRWLRDIAVLQLMDALNTLMSAGFTLANWPRRPRTFANTCGGKSSGRRALWSVRWSQSSPSRWRRRSP